MTELVVVGEGQTEESFIRQLIAPKLAELGVYATPRLLRTSRRASGGALTKDRVLHYLARVLKERDDVYVSTFFDLYGLGADFPGLGAAKGHSDPAQRAAIVEAALADTVVEAAACRPDRFLPHIQPYEFEALLLADTTAFAAANPSYPSWRSAEPELRRLVDRAGGPEHVNDDPDTHPSAVLKRVLPGYRKVAHGIAIATTIGLDRIAAQCQHFAQWLGRMEELRPLGPEADR